jgi:hypothetical protein
VNSWGLKVVATMVTMLAAAGAATYVGAHVRNGAAPLHPAVVETGGSTGMGLSPAVQPTDQAPVTGTHYS